MRAPDGHSPHVGLAYGAAVPEFLAEHSSLVDYLELPFEQLRQTPALASLLDTHPVILHCASLSIAGFVPPSEKTVVAIAEEASRMRTPWIGEHLAFVSADGLDDGATTGLTYTMCPQLSEETVDRVVVNLAALAGRLPVPLIIENSPQYFAVPGSTMTMTEFVAAVFARSDVEMLLDLTHLLITATNMGRSPVEELEAMPLERVREIHISGTSRRGDTSWDDHAEPAPPIVFELLDRALVRARPSAVTLEYNWSPTFPKAILARHLDHVRNSLVRSRAA